jgi:hypothetical protein
LLFSPSSSEGRSPARPGRRSSFSPSPSFADVVCDKGKELLEVADDPSLVAHSKGKAPMVGPDLGRSQAVGGPVGGFMADARRAHHGQKQPREVDWQLVPCHRQVHRPSNHLPPSLVCPPVPLDLIDRFFNCLQTDHVVMVCPNAACCLRCHREGHHARLYKSPRSPDAGVPPRCHLRSSAVVILNQTLGDISLVVPSDTAQPSRSSTRPGPSSVQTPEGSPSHHILPSPPSSSRPLAAASRRAGFELRVIPRTAAMDEADSDLFTHALMAMAV